MTSLVRAATICCAALSLIAATGCGADLKAVDPPDDVKDLHNELVSEMQEFKSQVDGGAAKSLDSGDATAVLKAQSKFAQSASTLGTRISKTISDIKTKLQG